jgi:hypothetical protein
MSHSKDIRYIICAHTVVFKLLLISTSDVLLPGIQFYFTFTFKTLL